MSAPIVTHSEAQCEQAMFLLRLWLDTVPHCGCLRMRIETAFPMWLCTVHGWITRNNLLKARFKG